MANCKLCGSIADKSGSHIVPHFLLVRVDGEDGTKLRDKGIGSTITAAHSSTYLERGISPEKWQELLGEYSDEDITQMGRNPSIIDYIVCTVCENKFGQLENEYKPTIDKFKDDNAYKSDIESGAALLFWISVLWRMSISNLYGFQLSSEQNELIRKALNTHMKSKFSDIDFEALYIDENLSNIGYRLIRSPNYSDNNVTAIICHPEDFKPYSLMIDEFLVFFYFDKSDIDKFYQKCFGFIHTIKHAKLNTLKDGEYILPVREADVKASIKTIIDDLKEQRLAKYNELFDKIHNECAGFGKMPIHIKQEIMDEITSDQKALGRKYTSNDVINSIAKVLHKY